MTRKQSTSLARSTKPEDLRNDSPQPHPHRRMTSQEFLKWINEYTRAQWVGGRVTVLPFADLRGNELQSWLLCVIGGFVEEHDLGRVIGSRLLFRLPRPQSWAHGKSVFRLPQKRMHLFRYDHFNAPDLVVEILSPKLNSTQYRENLKACEASGVKEHWAVDPAKETLRIRRLQKGAYTQIPQTNGAIFSHMLRELFIRPEWLWKNPLPSIRSTLREIAIK